MGWKIFEILLDLEAMIPLGCGVTSLLTLTVAMATDYWLVVWDEGTHPDKVYESLVKSHFGLWRKCTSHYFTNSQWCSTRATSSNVNTDYPTQSADIIFNCMTIPLVACVVAWSLLLSALIWSTADICRKGKPGFGGAVLYAFGALCVGAGGISFISAVNDYTFIRLQQEERQFMLFGYGYEYGWSSLYLLPASVTSAFVALISGAMVYARKYYSLEKRAKVKTRDYLTPVPNVQTVAEPCCSHEL